MADFLATLRDVNLSGLTGGDSPTWDATAKQWKPPTAWASGTPNVSQTNNVIGTAASFHRYKAIGKTGFVQMYFVCQTTTSASGNLIYTPPFACRDQTISIVLGTFQILGTINKSGTVLPFNTSNLVKFMPSGTNVNIGNGDGWVMTAGDILSADLVYETA